METAASDTGAKSDRLMPFGRVKPNKTSDKWSTEIVVSLAVFVDIPLKLLHTHTHTHINNRMLREGIICAMPFIPYPARCLPTCWF